MRGLGLPFAFLLQLAIARDAASETVTVRITDLAFVPAVITVRAGDVVQWVNQDIIEHTATAKGGEFDVAVPLNATAHAAMSKEGRFDYFCQFHPNMTGEIVVGGH